MSKKQTGPSLTLAILRTITLSVSILLGISVGYGASYYFFPGLRSVLRLAPWIHPTPNFSILFTLLAILGLLGFLVLFVRVSALVLREAFFDFHKFPTLTLKQVLSVLIMMILVGAMIYLSMALYVRLLIFVS